MRWIRFIPLMFCVLSGFCQQRLFSQSSAGNIYYVSPSGSDGNPGSITAPWKTVQKAVTSVNPGDTIYAREGTYDETVNINKSGLEGSPITLAGYPGETAVLDGGTSPAIQDNGNHEYWVIDHLTLQSQNTYTTMIGWWHNPPSNYWIIRNNHIYGSNILSGHYNIFENNDIDGTGYSQGGAGLQDIQEVSYQNTFRNNYIHDFTTRNGRGIWLQGHSHDDILVGNVIKNISGSLGQCIDSDGHSDIEWGHIIRNNTLTNCGYIGIQLENTWVSVIENNTLNTGVQGEAGIVVINYGDGMCKVGGSDNQYGDTNGDGDCKGDLTENIIQQNIIINAGNMGGIVSYDAGGVHVWNNLLAGSDSVGLWLDSYPYTRNWDVRGNIFFNNNYAEISASNLASLSQDDYNDLYHFGLAKVYRQRMDGSTLTLDQYRTRTGQAQHSINADPLFVNSADGNYHLEINSPAKDSSTPLNLPFDFDNIPRPQGNAFDMGVYEVPFYSLETTSLAKKDEIVLITIKFPNAGKLVKINATLPDQLDYISYSTNCPGQVTNDASRKVAYTSNLPDSLNCYLQLSTKVNTDLPSWNMLTVVIDNGTSNPQSLSRGMIFNGSSSYVPIVDREQNSTLKGYKLINKYSKRQ